MKPIQIGNDTGSKIFTPKLGRHYCIAQGNIPFREIYYKVGDRLPLLWGRIIINPLTERLHSFEFSWKQLMTEEEAEIKKLIPTTVYEKHSETASTTDGAVVTQKMCIVHRSNKEQVYLLDREVHAFDLMITSKDGSQIKFIFKFTLVIKNMVKILSDFPAGNFLNYAEDLMQTEIAKILQPKKLDELRGVAKDDHKPEDKIGIYDDVDGIKNTLNDEFEPHGFILDKILPEAFILPAKTLERINAAQNIETQKLITEKEVLAAKAVAETEEIKEFKRIAIEEKRSTDVGSADVKILGQKLTALFDYQKNLRNEVDKTKAQVSLNHRGVTTLVQTGGTQEVDPINDIIANLVTTKTKGGSNV